jgi:hypothetical protein
MASPNTAFTQRLDPTDFAGQKLDRLLELRAVIDCLRRERESDDPLLDWVVARETTENH